MSSRDLWRVVKVITPRNNQRDVLACETFLAALVSAGLGQIALELAGVPGERMFLMRGDAGAVDAALAQLAAAYPQCAFEEVSPEHDPARACMDAQHVVELRLRDAPYLPLRTAVSREGRTTYEDFASAADPMVSLLAALDGLNDGETCLIQFALTPMPDDWAAYWRGAVDDVGQRARATPQNLLAGVLTGLAVMLAVWGMGILGLTMALHLSAGIGLAGVALLLAGGAFLWARLRMPSPPDPLLVKHKINLTAFRVRARVFVRAAEPDRADARVEQVSGALRAYSLAGGNGFGLCEASDTDPFSLAVEERSWTSRLPVLWGLWPSRLLPILNVTELASLWHLPHASASVQAIAYTSSRRVLPLPREVEDGVWVGTSRAQGRAVEVRLPATALRGNIGLVAKTQSGKSNLMALLVADVLERDPEATVIVVDPHRTLAQKVASLVTPEREAHTIYWSLADRERPFGLNLIDRAGIADSSSNSTPVGALLGASTLLAGSADAGFADKRVSDIIDAFTEIWPQNWGPRMEDYLRGPLLTMAAANEMLLRDFAFEAWLQKASTAFAANEFRVRRGRLDPLAIEMVEDTRQTFAQLQRPLRPMRILLHDQLQRLYVDYETANTTSADPEAIVKAVKALRKALLDDPRHSLAIRAYRAADGVTRPLQYTLLDVNPMLASSQMRESALGALDDARDRHILNWWRDSFDAYLALNARLLMDMTTPVRTKLNRFTASDIVRRIFGQPESTLDLAGLIERGGVLIVDLAAGVIGQETAALVGSAILNWIASIIFARQADTDGRRMTDDGRPPSDIRPSSSVVGRRIFLVVDEFQSIPGADYTFMLSELGKYGVQMCLGTQSLGLLDELNRKTRRAWLDNTSALFVFRCGADDARDLGRELSVGEEDELTITPSDIVGLPEYSCFVRVRGIATPFRIDTRKADDGDPQTFEGIREASRQRYGRDATLVDEWLAQAGDLHGKPDVVDSAGKSYMRPVPKVELPEANSGELNRNETEAGIDRVGDYAVSVEKESDEVTDG